MCKLGAPITGLNLNDISDENLEALREVTHKYQLVVIKDQHEPDPVKHWELVSRLDPTAPQVHGHGRSKNSIRPEECFQCAFPDSVLKQAELISIRNELSTEYQQLPTLGSWEGLPG